MKKLVLILILTIGFFYEGKAQIAPSSEIHYYLKVENSNSREIELIKFESQDKVICYSASYFPELADYFETSLSDKEQKLNNYRQEQFKFIWYYSPQESTLNIAHTDFIKVV